MVILCKAKQSKWEIAVSIRCKSSSASRLIAAFVKDDYVVDVHSAVFLLVFWCKDIPKNAGGEMRESLSCFRKILAVCQKVTKTHPIFVALSRKKRING